MSACTHGFHVTARGDCVHCLGFELAMARAEIARLQEWIAHLVDPARDATGGGN